MITIDAYLDKVCRDTEGSNAAVEEAVKKYCKDFTLGGNGYCEHYIKPVPLIGKAKVSENVYVDVEAYDPYVMSCCGQCKLRICNG